MTLEQRFAALAVDFAVATQDASVLRTYAAELSASCEKDRARIEEARSIIIAMMQCAATACGLDPSLSERASDWLKEV